jgi:anti-sigma B factor antagonist
MTINEHAILEIVVDHERLDAMAAPAFRDQVAASLAGSPERVLLDLHLVQFVDSTGLGVFVSLLKMMGPGGRIAVIGVNEGVKRLFQMTRLDTLFRLCDNEDQARAILA